MDYATLKLIHVSAVALSLLGFLIRGAAILRGATWVRRLPPRIIQHTVDSVLLLAALGMTWEAHLSPLHLPWLRAKLAGLILYVLLGSIALGGSDRPGAARPLRLRLVFWIAALSVFGYIVSVALTKDPRGWLRWVH